jgi:hypothetical protein
MYYLLLFGEDGLATGKSDLNPAAMIALDLRSKWLSVGSVPTGMDLG